jgi:tetratricopeptide (TPR) repeat protein
LGAAYVALGRYEEAAQEFTKAFSLDSNEEYQLKLADCQAKIGHYVEAAETLLETSGDDAFTEAVEVCKRAVSVDPQDA